MTRTVSLVSAAALVCFLAGSIAMGRLDRGGPAHDDVWLEGGVPGTLFLPGPLRASDAFRSAPAEGGRPPALVLMHGFAGDRASVSSLARRMAAAGIAVLTIDATGHGRNRNPYRRSRAEGGSFAADLAAAVDFLRAHSSIDGTRIAVAGHSMGAEAALDYASRDSAIAAAVLISGGRRFDGPFLPANALFLYADGDPERIRSRVTAVASRVVGVARAEPGRTYGDPDRGDAVRLVELSGTDHVGIVWREEAAGEALRWLHRSFGLEGTPAAPVPDPRMPLLVLLVVAFVCSLPGLGIVAARLAPERELPSDTGRWVGVAWVGAAFLLTMPLLVGVPPLAVVPLDAGDGVAAQFALAGLALLVAIQLYRPEILAGVFARPWATLWAGAVTLVAVTSLLQPMGLAVHRVGLTPERGLAWLGATFSFLPLALSFNLLVRRGPTGGATLAVVCGRLVMLFVMVLGIGLGVLAPVMALLLPALAVTALAFEALASFLYAGSRNVVAIALVDAGWLALVLAAIMPIRI